MYACIFSDSSKSIPDSDDFESSAVKPEPLSFDETSCDRPSEDSCDGSEEKTGKDSSVEENQCDHSEPDTSTITETDASKLSETSRGVTVKGRYILR